MVERKHASFTAMENGTPGDYALVSQWIAEARGDLVDTVMGMLRALGDNDHGYAVSRYVHSLQTATLAYEDGADEETVVAALLHDIGDTLAPENHSELAASVLKPYLSERMHWIVEHHGVFQGYYFWHHYGMNRNARDAYKDHPYYQDCIDWCYKYDQCAFDPDYDTKPEEFFRPMVERIFARKPWSMLGKRLDGSAVTASAT